MLLQRHTSNIWVYLDELGALLTHLHDAKARAIALSGEALMLEHRTKEIANDLSSSKNSGNPMPLYRQT